jgi:hypothetical protein
MLMQQLEQLPSICRYQYKDVGAFVMGFIEPKAAEYKVGLYSNLCSVSACQCVSVWRDSCSHI